MIDSSSTVILSTVGLAFYLNSATFLLRRTRPAEIKSPQSRQEPYLAWARMFCNRSGGSARLCYACWSRVSCGKRWIKCWSSPQVSSWFPFASTVQSPSRPPRITQKNRCTS